MALVDRLGTARRYAYWTALAAGLGYVIVGGIASRLIAASSSTLRLALWALLGIAGAAVAVGVACAVARWVALRATTGAG